MNDKELLKLAAKAAGIEFANQSDEDVQLNQFVNNKHLLKNGEYWNPLTDDGDALRLAVNLKIDIHFEWNSEAIGNIVEAFTPEREDGSRGCFDKSTETDPYTATRRAIVRAAAEIGKTK